MSECKICKEHGRAGVMIAWDDNIKTKSGRYVPLESDKITPHRHYEPTAIIANDNGGNGSINTSEFNSNSNLSSAIATTKQQEITIEELTEEFQSLVRHMVSYLQIEVDR